MTRDPFKITRMSRSGERHQGNNARNKGTHSRRCSTNRHALFETLDAWAFKFFHPHPGFPFLNVRASPLCYSFLEKKKRTPEGGEKTTIEVCFRKRGETGRRYSEVPRQPAEAQPHPGWRNRGGLIARAKFVGPLFSSFKTLALKLNNRAMGESPVTIRRNSTRLRWLRLFASGPPPKEASFFEKARDVLFIFNASSLFLRTMLGSSNGRAPNSKKRDKSGIKNK